MLHRHDDTADDLRMIASLLERLGPDRRDPEAFFVQRNALAVELRRLAHVVDAGASSSTTGARR
jgi:hypothetical protein